MNKIEERVREIDDELKDLWGDIYEQVNSLKSVLLKNDISKDLIGMAHSIHYVNQNIAKKERKISELCELKSELKIELQRL